MHVFNNCRFFFRAEIRPFFLISIKSGRELIYIHTYNMHAFSEYLLNEKNIELFPSLFNNYVLTFST